ncbi:beta-galactosidase trimerization domain-containing protein [Paenibacillus sp. 1P07SE]|uniref:beta-galactosidase trimerization domain-containing protein n=1 Tax=Paenibacillus sp. 1P07SE TaxID=3132209 RepID=UPI0039A53A84
MPTNLSKEGAWQNEPLRIIQPNLQVLDTAKIDPRQLARQIKGMGANAMVFNVGGIYAWYPSRVPYHTVNEHLPQHTDLLRDVIEACHEEGVRFIARFDFSKAEDQVFLRRPQWFVRKADGEPEIIGAGRPGAWSLLMNTCLNSGYRNEDVAEPVLREVLADYDIDGIFFNAPHYMFCRCRRCQSKYEAMYNKPLPETGKELEPDFASRCIRDTMERKYKLIKETRPEVPMILYYNLYRDNIYERIETADLLCIEPQDVLSLGHTHIPEFWKPALCIKLGRSLPERPAPLGIVHSCPGMDWRHTGLPPAEYRFWLAQIPAHGGQIWHSLTGVPETITDKRILNIVGELNHNAAKVERYMHGAQPASQLALLWNADRSAEGWADGLINSQLLFDVLLPEQATAERLAAYRVIIVPEGYAYTEAFAKRLEAYVQSGGHVIAEGGLPDEAAGLPELLGIAEERYTSEELLASYLRFEPTSQGENPLQSGLEETELIAHRGVVTYCRPLDDESEVLATLVPPFSPLESVGAPPERASLPVPHSDLPLALRRPRGAGSTLYFPFQLSRLINEYKLGEHYQLLSNSVVSLLGEERQVRVTAYQGLQITLFRKDKDWLLHLVNGAGRRPLATMLPLHDIEIELKLPGTDSEYRADCLIGGTGLDLERRGDSVYLTLPRLEVWECIRFSPAEGPGS